jgi:hypothetical protein
MSEKLTPERAVRLLRAKAGELEQYVLDSVPVRPFDPMVLVADVAQFAADIALIAQLLADHIEANQTVRITGPEASGTKYPPRDEQTCLATRWNGHPVHEGEQHDPHNFKYGPNDMYEGHCAGWKIPWGPDHPDYDEMGQ